MKTLLCAAFILGLIVVPELTGGPVSVILWFDTEDYLLPASDDAAKRLALLLSERGIRATFKVVGEKARVLEKRGRTDVIEALRKHDIAFHSDFHSVHPTPSEYLADCGLLDGISEFVRREGPGAQDVRRIFGVDSLSCYGQPGSSWASQAIAGLKQIGVTAKGTPCYVDDGSHIGLKGIPFWYEGALVVYDMLPNRTRMELHDPAAVERGKQEVTAIAERLRRDRDGGLISIFYHPCEWVHREFWDGVNFARGKNPPREEWKAPGQLPPEKTDAAFERFGAYVDHIKSLPDIHFVTARDLPEQYPDLLRTQGAAAKDLTELARRLTSTNAIYFQSIGGKKFSAADQFELFTMALVRVVAKEPVPDNLKPTDLLGPDAMPPTNSIEEISWSAFQRTLRDVQSFLKSEHRIPSRIFIGAEAISPAQFLMVMARAIERFDRRDSIDPGAKFVVGGEPSLSFTRHVAADTPGLFGGWIIHRADFRAPKILEVARLQAWTLKPALRKAALSE